MLQMDCLLSPPDLKACYLICAEFGKGGTGSFSSWPLYIPIQIFSFPRCQHLAHTESCFSAGQHWMGQR